MKKQDLEKFKKRLLDERVKVLQAKSAKSGKEGLNTQSGDQADMASAEMELDAMYLGDQRGHNLLADISEALRKIDDKTYGECESCGEDIALARLEANPMAKLCIDCKSAEEIRAKKFAKTDSNSDSDGVIEGGSGSFEDSE